MFSTLAIRIVGILLLFASAGIGIAIVRTWLSADQRALLAFPALLMMGLGMIIALFPSWAPIPALLMVFTPMSAMFSIGIWINHMVLVRRVRKYRNLAEEARSRGELAKARAFEQIADTTQRALGRLNELKPSGA